MTNGEKHKKILDELHNTYNIKNKMYGDSFSESIKEWGYAAVGIRITDKFLRMKQLLRSESFGNNGTDESLRDTLSDMANYCIMSIMQLDEKKDMR